MIMVFAWYEEIAARGDSIRAAISLMDYRTRSGWFGGGCVLGGQ